MANSCPQRAGPRPGPKGRARAEGRGPPPGPTPALWDLLADVVLTSVGGLGVKGRGEGMVWVREPLCPSVVASGGSKSSKIEGLGFLKPLQRGVVASPQKALKSVTLQACWLNLGVNH